MKEITLHNKNYLLVEVPDDAHDFRLSNDNGIYYYIPNNGQCFTKYFGEKNINNLFKIVGKLSDIIKNEDICHTLAYNELKSVGYVYLDWQQPDNEKRPYKFDNPSDSFLSYLQSIDFDMTKQYLFIQKL